MNRTQSAKCKKNTKSGVGFAYNLPFDLSSEWNHKSSVISSSGCNRTTEYLQNKLYKIVERKQEKQQLKQFQQSEKKLRNELYGIFSKQSRDQKQKRLHEIYRFELLQKQISSQTSDPQQILRVNSLVRQSIETQQVKKRIDEEEEKKAMQEQEKRAEQQENYNKEIRELNREKQERKQSRESSLKKEENLIAWGIDQRKFGDKRPEIKHEKIFCKDNIDLKQIFSQNEKVNQFFRLLKNKQNLYQNENEQIFKRPIQTHPSHDRLKSINNISMNDSNKIMEQRFEKIMQERNEKKQQESKRKNEIQKRLQSVEKERQKSLQKCKKVVFHPTEEQISQAFNLDLPSQENEKSKKKKQKHIQARPKKSSL